MDFYILSVNKDIIWFKKKKYQRRESCGKTHRESSSIINRILISACM